MTTQALSGKGRLGEIRYNSATVAQFGYDDALRRTSRTLGDAVPTQTTWSYINTTNEKDNRIYQISRGGSPVMTYSYDENGNKLREQIASPMDEFGFGANAEAGYDNEDRLTSWTRDGQSPTPTQAWELTAAGGFRGLYARRRAAGPAA